MHLKVVIKFNLGMLAIVKNTCICLI